MQWIPLPVTPPKEQDRHSLLRGATLRLRALINAGICVRDIIRLANLSNSDTVLNRLARARTYKDYTVPKLVGKTRKRRVETLCINRTDTADLNRKLDQTWPVFVQFRNPEAPRTLIDPSPLPPLKGDTRPGFFGPLFEQTEEQQVLPSSEGGSSTEGSLLEPPENSPLVTRKGKKRQRSLYRRNTAKKPKALTADQEAIARDIQELSSDLLRRGFPTKVEIAKLIYRIVPSLQKRSIASVTQSLSYASAPFTKSFAPDILQALHALRRMPRHAPVSMLIEMTPQQRQALQSTVSELCPDPYPNSRSLADALARHGCTFGWTMISAALLAPNANLLPPDEVLSALEKLSDEHHRQQKETLLREIQSLQQKHAGAIERYLNAAPPNEKAPFATLSTSPGRLSLQELRHLKATLYEISGVYQA